jgi:putative ABC transport system permease protein
MRHLGLEGDAEGSVYLAGNAMRRAQFLVVRTERPANECQEALRRAVASVDPQQPVLLSASMQTLVRDSLAVRRFLMLLLAATGGLALAMSAAGVYGVMAYTTSRRTQEIGIRMALGATPRNVHGLVFREGFASVAIGLAIGGGTTEAAEKVLRAFLPGLTGGGSGDIWLAAALVVSTAALACWIPSRRAMLVDPMVALGGVSRAADIYANERTYAPAVRYLRSDRRRTGTAGLKDPVRKETGYETTSAEPSCTFLATCQPMFCPCFQTISYPRFRRRGER